LTIPASAPFAGYFEPSEPKDIAYLFTETNTQTLRTGLKIGPLQIVNIGLGRRFAE